MRKVKLERDSNGQVVMPEADLSGADLRHESLQGADLRGADLQGAKLQGADLRGADLEGADLEVANLAEADLRKANLSGAKLQDTDIFGANLRDADLREARLEGADLVWAKLSRADLRGAELRRAKLRKTDLQGADLRGAIGIDEVPRGPVADLAARVLGQITGHPESLDMDEWHSECGTRHCLAGWAVTLAGEVGKAAEGRLGTGSAARLLLGGCDHPFSAEDGDEVIPWLEARVAEEDSDAAKS